MALDIGTTKICGILAVPTSTGKFNILALAKKPSLGVIKGEVYNAIHASKVISETVTTVLNKGRVKNVPLFLSLNSGTVQFKSCSVFINKRKKSPINENDMIDVREQVENNYNAPGTRTFCIGIQQLIIHHEDRKIPLQIQQAMGVEAQTIEAIVSTVKVNERVISMLEQVLKDTGLQVAGFCLQPIASASATLAPEEAKKGTLLIDIGGGTTDVALIKDNVPLFVGVIQLGGKTITGDIASIFNVSEEEAEKLKLSAGKIYTPQLVKSLLMTKQYKPTHREKMFNNLTVEQVCLARVYEIFELVIDIVGRKTINRHCKNIVLTGGGSLMEGIASLAEKVFMKSTRVGHPGMWIEKSQENELPKENPSPIYSTAVGILVEAWRNNFMNPERVIENHTYIAGESPMGGSLLRKIVGWLQELFPFGRKIPSLLPPEDEDPRI